MINACFAQLCHISKSNKSIFTNATECKERLWDGRMEIKNQDKEKRWSENFWRCATDCKNPLLFSSFPFLLFAMMLKFDTFGNLFCAFYSMRERGRNWWLVSMATHVTTAHPFFGGETLGNWIWYCMVMDFKCPRWGCSQSIFPMTYLVAVRWRVCFLQSNRIHYDDLRLNF